MNCFSACFSDSKKKKQSRRTTNKTQRHVVVKDEHVEVPGNPIAVNKEKVDDPLSCSSEKEFPVDLVKEALKAEPSEKIEIETPKECDLEDDNDDDVVTVLHLDKDKKIITEESSECDLENDNDDDVVTVIDLHKENKMFIEESSESLFSLSIGYKKQVCDVEMGEKEVNSPMPNIDMNQCSVDSVIPAENLDHCSTVKPKTTTPQKHWNKENIDVGQGRITEDHVLKLSTQNQNQNPCLNLKKPAAQEMSVNTSLSSWLVGPEKTPLSNFSTDSVKNSPTKNVTKSPTSYEDRPILGALTLEDIKQHSACTTPTKSGTRSREETPIIGTVGSYWSHTGRTMDSCSVSPHKRNRKVSDKKIRDENEAVHLRTMTAFELRLEMAMNQEVTCIKT